MIRFFAWLFNWTIVCLIDYTGESYITKVNFDSFGLWCYVYPFVKVGHVRLNIDGSCSGQSSYIKEWKLVRQRVTK